MLHYEDSWVQHILHIGGAQTFHITKNRLEHADIPQPQIGETPDVAGLSSGSSTDHPRTEHELAQLKIRLEELIMEEWVAKNRRCVQENMFGNSTWTCPNSVLRKTQPAPNRDYKTSTASYKIPKQRAKKSQHKSSGRSNDRKSNRMN